MDKFEDVGVPAQEDANIPRWLFWSYLFWIVTGFTCLYLFWGGSWGWFDRGHWHSLQEAARTTPPYEKESRDRQ